MEPATLLNAGIFHQNEILLFDGRKGRRALSFHRFLSRPRDWVYSSARRTRSPSRLMAADDLQNRAFSADVQMRLPDPAAANFSECRDRTPPRCAARPLRSSPSDTWERQNQTDANAVARFTVI